MLLVVLWNGSLKICRFPIWLTSKLQTKITLNHFAPKLLYLKLVSYWRVDKIFLRLLFLSFPICLKFEKETFSCIGWPLLGDREFGIWLICVHCRLRPCYAKVIFEPPSGTNFWKAPALQSKKSRRLLLSAGQCFIQRRGRKISFCSIFGTHSLNTAFFVT